MRTSNQETYAPVQNLIRDVAQQAGVDPIVFDIYAWHADHLHITSDIIKLMARREDYVSLVVFAMLDLKMKPAPRPARPVCICRLNLTDSVAAATDAWVCHAHSSPTQVSLKPHFSIR